MLFLNKVTKINSKEKSKTINAAAAMRFRESMTLKKNEKINNQLLKLKKIKQMECTGRYQDNTEKNAAI